MGFLDSLGQSNKPLLAINETQRRPPMPASAHSRRGYRTYLAFLAFAVGLTLLWQQHSHHEGASKAHPNDIHNRTLGVSPFAETGIRRHELIVWVVSSYFCNIVS